MLIHTGCSNTMKNMYAIVFFCVCVYICVCVWGGGGGLFVRPWIIILTFRLAEFNKSPRNYTPGNSPEVTKYLKYWYFLSSWCDSITLMIVAPKLIYLLMHLFAYLFTFLCYTYTSISRTFAWKKERLKTLRGVVFFPVVSPHIKSKFLNMT